jgi:hypothetical protein
MDCPAAPLWFLIKVPYQPEVSAEGQVLYPRSNSSTVRSSDLPARAFSRKWKNCPGDPQFYLLYGAYLSVLKAEVLQYGTKLSSSSAVKWNEFTCRYSQLREYTPVQNCLAALQWFKVNLPASTLSWESTLQYRTVQQLHSEDKDRLGGHIVLLPINQEKNPAGTLSWESTLQYRTV